MADYLERYVYAPATYEDYLDLFGGERAGAPQRAARELDADGMSASYTPSELLAVMGSRQLADDTTVFAGVGVPLLAAVLAQQRARAAADDGDRGRHHRARRSSRAAADLDQRDARGLPRPDAARHHRRVPASPSAASSTYGFIGGAQIDQYGNLNTSVIGSDYWKPEGAAAGHAAAPTTSPRSAAR